VLVPRNPGIRCAMGMLLADLRADFAATRLMALSSAVISEIETINADLHRRCALWFAEAGIDPEDRRVALSVDMRYRAKLRAVCAIAFRAGHTSDDRWACRWLCRRTPAALRLYRRG
jgi:N-methylhydantoinase A/oxoprolinase/acetone carboxylase beta subunit